MSSTSHEEEVASLITNASVLAFKSEFTQWASLVRLDPDIRSRIPPDPAFQAIRDIRNLSNRFPTWLTDPDSAQFKYLPETYHSLKNDLCSTLLAAKNRDPGRFHEEDDLPLAGTILPILQTCHRTMILGRQRMNPTEIGWCVAIDGLLLHICEVGEGAVMSYSTEQDLKLPQARFGRCDVTHTMADGVMLAAIDFKPYRANPEMQTAATALCSEIPRHLQVVHCVVEFEGESSLSGANKAIMGVVSAAYQKRVLGVPGQFTFGVFQYQKYFVQVFAGAWQAK
ncbi:unnamed protein product [Rhizoctonia solani]|uniref:Uncharacterized protein n=1 Tax=Rhizoctonia solani TaxID=456999 RepID=A0A8H3DYV0_9AGAM|nr:unnamed protein product [Rhizoctonia solani]